MMDKPNMINQLEENQGEEVDAPDTISWKDALEDLERQKEMMSKSQARTRPIEEKVPEKKLQRDNGSQLPTKNLQFILDIPLQITVELGHTRLLVNDLLQLGQGSVIELTKQVGEPLEILINQKLIARGEVVVVNDKFGVRLTDILSPMERVERLR